MTGRTHLIGGLLFGTAATCLLKDPSILDMGIVVTTALCGSVLPDLDQTHSMAGKKVRIVSYPIYILRKLFAWLGKKTGLKLFKRIARDLSHRGILHAPLFWLLLLTVAWFMIPQVAILLPCLIGLLSGLASHLVLDTFNPTGIAWLYPIQKKIHIGRVITGTRSEVIFNSVLSAGCALVIGLCIAFHIAKFL